MPEELYVIKSSNGKYISLDDASGGYPVDNDHIHQAQLWPSSQEKRLRQYMKTGPLDKSETWTVHRVIITTEPLPDFMKPEVTWLKKV